MNYQDSIYNSKEARCLLFHAKGFKHQLEINHALDNAERELAGQSKSFPSLNDFALQSERILYLNNYFGRTNQTVVHQ